MENIEWKKGSGIMDGVPCDIAFLKNNYRMERRQFDNGQYLISAYTPYHTFVCSSLGTDENYCTENVYIQCCEREKIIQKYRLV